MTLLVYFMGSFTTLHNPIGCTIFMHKFIAWDRCRRKCPAAKPEPPTVEDPNRQLIPYDSDTKWNRELWEEEGISYGCTDASLVLDRDKNGKKSETYFCDKDGTYAVPDGQKDNRWPVCTDPPVSQCKCMVIRNITLLTITMATLFFRHHRSHRQAQVHLRQQHRLQEPVGQV
jgi:hypothetical protein